jgi:hypothetical protein
MELIRSREFETREERTGKGRKRAKLFYICRRLFFSAAMTTNSNNYDDTTICLLTRMQLTSASEGKGKRCVEFGGEENDAVGQRGHLFPS